MKGVSVCHEIRLFNPRVRFSSLHPTESMNLEMVGNRPTNQKAPSSLASFFSFFVTVVSKATNWCTGSLSLWSKNIKGCNLCLRWSYTIDIDLSFYIYIMFLCGYGESGKLEYLVIQVSFFILLVSAVSCILPVCWRLVLLQGAGD